MGQNYKKSKGFTWLTWIFNIFNLCFLILGAINFVAFFYEIQKGSHYINLLDSKTYQITLYLLLTASCLILISSILGLIGTSKQLIVILIINIIVLILICLFELTVVVTSYVYTTNLEWILRTDMNITFLTYYKIVDYKSVSIDFVQQTEGCCGIHYYSDWKSSYWLNDDTNILNIVPDSCCISSEMNCGIRVHPSNIYLDGCFDVVTKQLKHLLCILLGVSLGTFTIPILGIICCCLLIQKIRKNKEKESFETTRLQTPDLYF